MQPHCCGADCFFDDKEAKKQTRTYLKKGPRRSTAALSKMINRHFKDHKSLLDIGGGIGVLGLELRKSGLESYTGVDASTAYQNEARILVPKTGMETRFIKGDFVEVQNEVDSADIVTLDKVVCCYPDMSSLLSASMDKSRSLVGLVYPMGGFGSRFFSKLGNLFLRIRNTAFRTYIHPPSEISAKLVDNGFRNVDRKMKFPWVVELYERA